MQTTWAPRLLFCCGGVLLLGIMYFVPPTQTGDSFEYHFTLQAWFNHGSPDVRAADVDDLAALMESHHCPAIRPALSGYYCFVPSATGDYYGCHFWLYALCGVPAKWVLCVTGGNETTALQLTNGLIFLLALYWVLFHAAASLWTRLTFVGLSAVTPVIWYLRWSTPEVLTWSLVLLALSLATSRKYVWAAACAALAATQNPPVLFLAGSIAVFSLRERSWKLTLFTGAAVLLAFLPNACYLLVFHHFNPIDGMGGVSPRFISWARTWSFFMDFNVGLLPYVPVLLLLAGWATFRSLRTRSLLGLGVWAVILAMVLTCELISNWNCGAALMMRYAVWVVPPLAWLAAEYLPRGRRSGLAVAGAVALHGLLLFQHDGTDNNNCARQTPLASFILTKAPALYFPEMEIFGERQLGKDGIGYPEYLPIPFVTPRGKVTKLLVDAESLDRLGDEFRIDPAYLATVRQKYHDRRGLFFLTPPSGKVWARPVADRIAALSHIRLAVTRVPERVTSPQVSLRVTVSNHARVSFLGRDLAPGPNGFPTPLTVSYQLEKDGRVVSRDQNLRSLIPHSRVKPGETVRVPVQVELPREKGRYVLKVLPVLEGIAWGTTPLQFQVNVLDGSSQSYSAELSRSS
jgi:hypothetical protein